MTSPASTTRRTFRVPFTVILALSILVLAGPLRAQIDNETCLDCHDDAEMTDDAGRFVGVPAEWFESSVHGSLDCVDCHSEVGDFDDAPHWEHYTKVDCSQCHEDEAHSFGLNFHAKAREHGNADAPTCASCHGIDGNAHRMQSLDSHSAEGACRRCHTGESAAFDRGVHAEAAAAGKDAPGCITCHQSHGPGLPPAAGAVSKLCAGCHEGTMVAVERGGHFDVGETMTETLNCVSCHEAHETVKPKMSARVAQRCANCHKDEVAAFDGTVHEELFDDGDMNCVSCHSTHIAGGKEVKLDAGCAVCHEDEEEAYRSSVHRLGRIRGSHAASCADCHDGHHILAATDTASTISPRHIPETCSQCHAGEPVITSNFVRLPVSLPNYLESIHGQGWRGEIAPDLRWNKGRAAVCTDCHGSHDMRTAEDPESSINHHHIAETCGQCHDEIARQYMSSIHGQALAVGIRDAPTCIDCHDEHLVQAPADPKARINPEHRAKELCGECHTDPKLAAKYGVEAGVVESYLDSYHGWAIDRGSTLAATCTDCHNVHEIRSPIDPESSVHPANVTQTCARCHENANPTFAKSYTHAGALQARGYHDWARMIYIALIVVVLGGMAVHNFVIARYEFRRIQGERMKEPYVQRWHSAERIQHVALLLSFTGLAITGFALRFHDSWWVGVIGLGGHEALRANLHRALAVLMTLVALYHAVWILVTRRGRWALFEMAPRGWDLSQVFQNMAFHLGLRRERPAFRVFDYTQKAEYWAVVWGTIVMAVTGLVLWFPTAATEWMPPWAVRVSEVVHFYEAILAVSAIVIWHFFYVIFMPSEYPMSMVWLNGRHPAREWKEFHRQEYNDVGPSAIRDPAGGPEESPPRPSTGPAADTGESSGGERN